MRAPALDSTPRAADNARMAAGRSILYLCASPVLGGAQRGVLELMRRIPASRFRPALLTGGDGPLTAAARAAGFETLIDPDFVRPLAPTRDANFARRLERLLRCRRFDLVSAHGSKAGIVGRWAARRAGVRAIVFTAHGFVFLEPLSRGRRALYRALERRAARWCDAIVAVSAHDRDAGRAAGVGRAAQYAVIRNGLDLAAFDAAQRARAGPRAALGLPAAGPLVGAVAMWYRNKGLDVLIDAAALLARARPDLRVVVAGGESPDRLGPALRARLARRAATGVVRLLGVRDDVPALLAHCDVVAHLSRKEGLPWALLEAQAARRAVVATDVGGAGEVVAHGVTGLLVPPARPDLAARAIAQLLDDPARRARMGAAGRARVERLFTIERMIAERTALYERLCAPARRRVQSRARR